MYELSFYPQWLCGFFLAPIPGDSKPNDTRHRGPIVQEYQSPTEGWDSSQIDVAITIVSAEVATAEPHACTGDGNPHSPDASLSSGRPHSTTSSQDSTSRSVSSSATLCEASTYESRKSLNLPAHVHAPTYRLGLGEPLQGARRASTASTSEIRIGRKDGGRLQKLGIRLGMPEKRSKIHVLLDPGLAKSEMIFNKNIAPDRPDDVALHIEEYDDMVEREVDMIVYGKGRRPLGSELKKLKEGGCMVLYGEACEVNHPRGQDCFHPKP